MMPMDTRSIAGELDPVEYINSSLQVAWKAISGAFDVSSCMPDLKSLFTGVDLEQPGVAADELVGSMLLEVMECVGRFSPWYRRPARAFGLITIRDVQTGRLYNLLAPEAAQQWDVVIDRLEDMFRRYRGLLQALIMMDSMVDELPDDPCVAADCHCVPPRTIYLRRSILEQAEITCEACQQPYV